MKIGLLSIHSAHNYGSVLQAYALQEVLKQFGNEVELIDYRPNYFEDMYKLFSLRIYQKYPGIINKALHFAWRVIKLPQRIEKKVKFEHFMAKHYQLTAKKYRNLTTLKHTTWDYDVVFVGSDQVWNTDITEGFDPAFYLEFLSPDTIKASYAASIARPTIDQRYQQNYKDSLNKFGFISVREESGKKLLDEIIRKDVKVVLDPTLLLNKSQWGKIADESKMKIKGSGYIFTYILQDNPELAKIVNRVSKELNLPVISIGKKKRFLNETVYPNAGPEDFLWLIKHSSFVVTNSFHGSVFSVIFERPSLVVPHLTTGSRMVDLYNSLGLNKRIVRRKSLNINQNVTSPDYQMAQRKLQKAQHASTAFVEEVLHEAKKKYYGQNTNNMVK